MAVVSLAEAAKAARDQGNTLQASIIEIFALRSGLLRKMPFQDIPGWGIIYNQEGVLPGIAFRNVNEAYTPSVAVLNPASEQLKIAGGEIQVDKFIMAGAPEERGIQESMQSKAMADTLQYKFMKGNSSTSIKEFDGFERRLPVAGPNVIDNSAVDGGGALSFAKIDELLDNVEGANTLFMLKKTRRRMTEFLRGSGTAIVMKIDEFGRQVETYGGAEIVLADEFGVTASLTNTEVGVGGSTATATSIWAMRLELGYVHAINNGMMRVSDLGEMQSTPAMLTRNEWYVSPVIKHPRAISRLRGILTSTVAVA